MEYLHGLRITHRDLSLENVLLDSNEDSIIIDMGMCQRYPEGITPGTRAHFPAVGQFGKMSYMAPEVSSCHQNLVILSLSYSFNL